MRVEERRTPGHPLDRGNRESGSLELQSRHLRTAQTCRPNCTSQSSEREGSLGASDLAERWKQQSLGSPSMDQWRVGRSGMGTGEGGGGGGRSSNSVAWRHGRARTDRIPLPGRRGEGGGGGARAVEADRRRAARGAMEAGVAGRGCSRGRVRRRVARGWGHRGSPWPELGGAVGGRVRMVRGG